MIDADSLSMVAADRLSMVGAERLSIAEAQTSSIVGSRRCPFSVCASKGFIGCISLFCFRVLPRLTHPTYCRVSMLLF